MMQYFDIYHLKSSVQNYKPDSMKKTWIKERIFNSFRSLHLSNGPASTMAVQYHEIVTQIYRDSEDKGLSSLKVWPPIQKD